VTQIRGLQVNFPGEKGKRRKSDPTNVGFNAHKAENFLEDPNPYRISDITQLHLFSSWALEQAILTLLYLCA
jgi:hypothetical protein